MELELTLRGKPVISTMIARTVAVLAMAGSAAAFAPTMSAGATRREAMAGAAAAAVAAPLLRPSSAEAAATGMGSNNAPVITIMDHRDCVNRPNKVGPNKEYKGEYTGGEDDKMCIKLTMSKIAVSDNVAARILSETIGALKK